MPYQAHQMIIDWSLSDPELPQFVKLENVQKQWVFTRRFQEDLDNYEIRAKMTIPE
jgi:hypothetical protein